MLFNSYLFVFIFLPICLLGYYFAVNKRNGNYAKIWLIAMSLWFYGSVRIEYLLILFGSVLFNYAVWRTFFSKEKEKTKRDKMFLVFGITGNLALLVYVKYMNFFMESINNLMQGNLPLLKVLLPLGISFFTFQQISFLIDCYKGEIKECSFGDYVLYITYFPKLIEGPIVMHSEMLPQFQTIAEKTMDAERIAKGICLFVLGMGKKVILADTFGSAVNYGYSNLGTMHASDAVLLILFYALQLYFDFSGYCDMGRGISWMFGLELPVNFNSPYKARNIVDFWKRWHITLNRFFTKYIYIPLGGNRVGSFKMYRNLFVVFFLSGLWHGAGWNFILWGMLHGVLYVITRMWQKRQNMKSTISGIDGGKERVTLKPVTGLFVILTFLYVSAAWVFFRADSVAQGVELFRLIGNHEFVRINKNLAGCFNLDEFWYAIKILGLDAWEYGHYILMTVMTIFSLAVVFFSKNAAQLAEKMKTKLWPAILLSTLFLWCVLTFSKVSTFLYFNF